MVVKSLEEARADLITALPNLDGHHGHSPSPSRTAHTRQGRHVNDNIVRTTQQRGRLSVKENCRFKTREFEAARSTRLIRTCFKRDVALGRARPLLEP